MADVLSVIADVLNQDKKQKKEQAKMMREVQKKLKEKDSVEVAEEEGDKEDYMKFFAGKLKKYGVKSPAELSGEDKKKFFNEIEKDWKHDSSEEVEVEEKEENLGKRVKARMEAEDEKEDEDEDPVGDPDEDEADTDVVQGGEPTEDELDKLADLVVQKIKDKADDEEEEEEEPDATEAESGKEEKIDINPKMEQVLNPHARHKWEEALRQVYAKEDYTDLGGAGEEGTTTSDTDKDYGLHQFSDPKYVPAYTDQSFQTAPDNTGIGQNSKPTQSGTPNKAVGKATNAKKPASDDPKTGMDKLPVGTKSGTPDKAVGKAAAAKIAPRVTTKDGVATQKEEVELDERAKGDSIEGPAKGKKHKCPTYVKKEGYGYGKNISHSLSENRVDKMNIYWYDSKEVSFMMPTSEVEIVTEGMHSEEGHTEKFKSTKKIAEELRKLPNPFENIQEDGKGVHDPIDSEEKLEVGSHPDWPAQPKKKKKKVMEKRSVSFARKFYQKGEK